MLSLWVIWLWTVLFYKTQFSTKCQPNNDFACSRSRRGIQHTHTPHTHPHPHPHTHPHTHTYTHTRTHTKVSSTTDTPPVFLCETGHTEDSQLLANRKTEGVHTGRPIARFQRKHSAVFSNRARTVVCSLNRQTYSSSKAWLIFCSLLSLKREQKVTMLLIESELQVHLWIALFLLFHEEQPGWALPRRQTDVIPSQGTAAVQPRSVVYISSFTSGTEHSVTTFNRPPKNLTTRTTLCNRLQTGELHR